MHLCQHVCRHANEACCSLFFAALQPLLNQILFCHTRLPKHPCRHVLELLSAFRHVYMHVSTCPASTCPSAYVVFAQRFSYTRLSRAAVFFSGIIDCSLQLLRPRLRFVQLISEHRCAFNHGILHAWHAPLACATHGTNLTYAYLSKRHSTNPNPQSQEKNLNHLNLTLVSMTSGLLCVGAV